MIQLLVGEIAVGMFSDSFEDGNDIEIFFHTLDLAAAWKDGAAIDEYGRAVHATHGHHAGGHVFVAAADRDEAIHAFAADNCLDGVRDHFTGNERVFHALSAHRNAVGDGDGVEDQALASCRIHAFFRFDCELVDVDVAGRDLAPGGGNADLRLGEIVFLKTNRVKHRAARRTVGAIKHQTGKGAFLVTHRAGMIQYGVAFCNPLPCNNTAFFSAPVPSC